MKRLVIGLLLLMAAKSEAQTFSRYIITFRNKANTPFALNNPIAYLSQRSVDRRTRYGIAIDSTDLPVTPAYLDSIRSAGTVTVLNVSRWLNQVSVQTADEAALSKIASFTFVQSAAPIAARIASGKSGERQQAKAEDEKPGKKTFQPQADHFNYGASYQQIHIHNGEFLHNIGLRGQDMIFGILDAGFRSYTTLPSFDSVNINGQVLGTYDFVARDTSVVEDDSHGMQCFSVIAANIPSQFVGAAPKAGFFLFRTEDASSEYQIEEHNWVCGAERTDSAGGDVISSSLGYSNDMGDPRFNHTYAEMNGDVTIAARGADMAAKKGLLVVNSAGNQGNEPFRYIATPADGDSVLAVGAVNGNGQVATFSSYGPSPDGRVKPDVASVGVATVVQNTGGSIGTNNGTSFACPNMAGLAACLWQGFREMNNMKIINALRQAGSKASAPDERIGYGIPDVKKAVMTLLKDFSSATVTLSAPCRHTINWTSKDAGSMLYEIERRGAGQTAFKKIGIQQGTGIQFGTRSYQFTDSTLDISPGQVLYRIRQVIDTASATLTADYIDSVSIMYNMACDITSLPPVAPADADVAVMPNPASDKISLRLSTTYPSLQLFIRILDSRGVTVLQRKTTTAPGTSTTSIPVNHLAKGTYYIEIYKAEKRLAVKEFVKL